jgi:hypothetical protein
LDIFLLGRVPIRIQTLVLAAAGIAGAALVSGCTEGGYGRTSVAVGYNASYGDPYWGWYGDYYYPGTGVYVYDRSRRRIAWSAEQRGYWEGRRGNWRGDRRRMRSNWGGFRRR